MQPLRPHKNEYWLFPKISCWQSFTQKVQLICELIQWVLRIAQNEQERDMHLISVDEKTGIQALSRLEGRAPDSRKASRRQEFEYQRNGTTTLMAALDVATNQVIHHRIHPTRKEEDFLIFAQQTAQKFPQDHKVVFLADQLNIHLSESLVKWIAHQENDTQDLGSKGKVGILKSKKSRIKYLENQQHRIQFVYTPKHCSWLNPIENWFAKLQRQVITNGNFSSVKEISQRIERYMRYYNKALRKPIKWKFCGFHKNKELVSIKWLKT